MNWLGAIGGVDIVLMFIVSTFIGGFSQFNASFQIINQQYFDNVNEQKDVRNTPLKLNEEHS